MTLQDVEKAKANGNYRRAGQMQALLGRDHYYGCHNGMRSSLEVAKELFRIGFNEANFYLVHGDIIKVCDRETA